MAEDMATAVGPMKNQAPEVLVNGGGPSHSVSASIPVVDLRRLTQTDASGGEEIEKLRSALGSWGFFQARGHGIPTSFLDELRRIGREFFDLPMEEKERYSLKGEGFAEGYGRDRVDTAAHAADWTDRILLFVEPENQRKLEFWPDNPSSFSETVHEYAARAKTVVDLIFRAMAKSLDLEESHFIGQFEKKTQTVCRFCHYPSCSRPDLVIGLRPHSDNSVLTIILEGGDVEGLELLKDDLWVKVPNNPDVLLVFVGDLMEIISNGMFKSTVHRVVSHPEKERISTALFYGIDPEEVIGPAEKLLDDGKPKLYRDLKVQDYLDVHLKSFSLGKRAIDWAKVL